MMTNIFMDLQGLTCESESLEKTRYSLASLRGCNVLLTN